MSVICSECGQRLGSSRNCPSCQIEEKIKDMATLPEPVYWLSPVGEKDDFGDVIGDEVIDGKTVCGGGQWGLMTPDSFMRWSGTGGKLGQGLGQRYKKQSDGRWLKVEG